MSDSKQRNARVPVVGATSVAGQQMLAALADHPDVMLTAVGTSNIPAGKSAQQD